MDYIPQFGGPLGGNTQDLSGLPQDDNLAQLELKRRLARAEALRNSEIPQGQMVGNQFVPPSWTQYLANAVSKYQGGKQEREAIKQYGEYTKTKAQKQADALRQLTGDLEGTKTVNQGSYQIQVPSGNAPQTENLGGMQPVQTGMKSIDVPMATTTTRAPTAADRYAAIMKYGSAINDPRMVQEAIMGGINQANKAEEVAGERTWREQQTKNEQEFNRIMQKDRQGFELSQQEKNFANQWKLQQSSQGFQAGQNQLNRQHQDVNAPLVTIYDPVTKQPKLVTRSQAVNAQPYSAAQEIKDAEKVKAQQQAGISAQQVLDQAQSLFSHPGRRAATGVSGWLGAGSIPATDAKDFAANLATFKAQTFVPMVSALKGMGALSDAEGKKLLDSVGALDPNVSEEAFVRNLQTATRTLYQKAKAAGLNVQEPEFLTNKPTQKSVPVLQNDVRSQADKILGNY